MRIGSAGVGGGIRISYNAIIIRVTASTGGGTCSVGLSTTPASAAGIPFRAGGGGGGGGGRLHVLGYQHAVENRLDPQFMVGEVEKRWQLAATR